MAGARQQEAGAAMTSILKKMEAMLDTTNEIYQEQLSVLSCIETVQTNVVAVELQKQTQILTQLSAQLSAKDAGVSADKGKSKEFAEAFGTIGKSLESLLKAAEKIDPKSAEKLDGFLTKLAESMNNFMSKVDAKAVQALSNLLDGIVGGVFWYSIGLLIATPFLLLSLPGAYLFGLSVRLLVLGMGEAANVETESLKTIVGLGGHILLFGLSMALFAIISPIVMIGSLLFGLSLKLLLLGIGITGKIKAEALETVVTLGGKILLYSLAMVAVTILSPIVIIGSLLFGLSVRLLFMAMGKLSIKQLAAMETLLSLAKGVLLYSLAMALAAVLSPVVLIGSVLFGLSVRLLFMAMGKLSIKQLVAMDMLLSLAKGVILYSLAMVVATLLSPIVIIGSVLFGLSVRLLFMAMGKVSFKQVLAMYMVMKLAKGVLWFGLAMVIFTLISPIVLIGSIIFGLTMFIISFGLKKMGTMKVLKGILSLYLTSLAILFLGLSMMLFHKMVEWEAMLKVGVAIGGLALALYVVGNFWKTIMKGALTLVVIGIALIIFSIGFAIFAAAVKTVTWENLAMMAATITFLALIGTVLGIPPISGFAAVGAGILILLGAAFAVFSVGFLIFAGAIKILDEGDPEMMGNVFSEIAWGMGKMGLASPLILLGSAAMIVAAAAMIPLSISLSIFKLSGFKQEDGDVLSYALESIVNGFLGGKMPGGILAGIKFAAGAAARAALLLVTAGPMLFAGMALIPITASLKTFKEAKFSKGDADSLEYMIGSIVRAFGIVTDYDRQKKMGFYVNPWDLMLGIASLSGAGRVLAGLAEGVQAWANLEVNEWEVVDAGTKDAKLVIKGRRKLTKSDFDNAAYGMSTVISAIAKPFAEVGRLEKGESTGNAILDAIFAGNFVSAGVEALKRSGDTIVSLAQGVQSFANLTITEFEVVDAGTKDAKLVPKSQRQMSPADIESAANNISMVIGVVANALAEVGKMEADSSGWFSGGYVSKGAEALGGVGDNIKAIADAVLSYANLEIPQFELINGGTKDAQLVPTNPIKLTDNDLKNAAYRIKDVLGIIVEAVADVGRMEDESDGWFSDGYVNKGKEALGNVGENIAAIANSVMGFATLQIQPMELINGGTDKAKLVPGKPIRLTESDITRAAYNLGNVINLMGKEVWYFGKWVDEDGYELEVANEGMGKISETIVKGVDLLKKWDAVKDPAPNLKKITDLYATIKDVFDPKKNKDIPQQSWYFTRFTTNAINMAEHANELERVVESFEKIGRSTKIIQTNINGFDLKKLTLTDSMFRSLAAMSKNPEAIAKMVKDTMEKSFKELIAALKELAAANTPPSSGDGGSKYESFTDGIKRMTGQNDGKNTPKDGNPPKSSGGTQSVNIMNVDALARAIASAIPG